METNSSMLNVSARRLKPISFWISLGISQLFKVLRSIFLRWEKAALTILLKRRYLSSSISGVGFLVNRTIAESTFGLGMNTSGLIVKQ